LKVVNQPHQAQFVVYSVRDDVAAAFDCESRITLGDAKDVPRVYGNYFGSTFNIRGRKDHKVALLWAKEDGYWKIVSWQTGADEKETPAPAASPASKIVRIPADASLVEAARGFLESWLIQKDYDAAFRYLSPKSYACYDLTRGPDQPASTSLDDAGKKIRDNFEQSGKRIGKAATLGAVLTAPQPVNPGIRVMDHSYSRAFTLASIPNVLAEAADCAARERGVTFPREIPLEYGKGFAMATRFRMRGGDPPVLRLLWAKENGDWRITAYDVEVP
jgi:hypothetical protein